ncbi:hypothetical protein ACAW74_25720 [Fibrella sp. WM1]|uniref:hypothetical protein n=1 Tax=Fibrella musci TaxID=3242485 RepID=UPI003522E8B4
MALQPEIWVAQLVENFYKDNEFMQHATPHDEFVLEGKVVHLAQAGSPSGVSVNRTSLPATISERTDTETTYVIDELTSDPVLIRNIDVIQLSYDKRQSIISNDMANIKEKGAENLLSRWVANLNANNIIRTTGAARSSAITGATGNRKAFDKSTMFAMKVKFDKDKVPAANRKCLLYPDQIDALLQDKDLAVNFVKYADLAAGIVGRVAGFDIFMRDTVLRFSNDATPVVKSPSSVVATDENAGALFWHPSCVARAMGDVKMFERLNDPTMYGDVYSFLLMFGGRGLRADGKGIGAVVEAASA